MTRRCTAPPSVTLLCSRKEGTPERVCSKRSRSGVRSSPPGPAARWMPSIDGVDRLPVRRAGVTSDALSHAAVTGLLRRTPSLRARMAAEGPAVRRNAGSRSGAWSRETLRLDRIDP